MFHRIALLALCMMLLHGVATAHDPHDVIDAIHMEPGKDGVRSTIYILRGYDTLLRSVDAGASWKELHNGIDNRHRLTDISGALRVDDLSVLFLATDGDGIFRSEDSGESWHKLKLDGLGVSRFSEIAVPHSKTGAGGVFAIGTLGGLFRSDDYGSSWKRVLDDDVSVKSVEFHKDFAGIALLVGDAAGRVGSSRDAGEHWAWVTLPKDVGAITSLQSVPGASGFDSLLLGTSHGGVYKWAGDEASLPAPSGKGMEDRFVTDLLLVSSNPLVVWASTRNDGVYFSTDGGGSWQLADTGLTKNKQAEQGVFRSPHFRGMEIDRSDREQFRVFLAGFDGLFVTTNPERGWLQLETEPVGRILSMSVSPVDRGRYLTAVTTYGAGVYTRPSDSNSWRIKTRGLKRPRVGAVVFSTGFRDDGLMYALEDEGSYLLRSKRGIPSWDTTELEPYWFTDFKRRSMNKLRRLGLPASVTTDLLTRRESVRSAHPKVIVVQKQSDSKEELFIGTRWRGLFHSSDGGVTIGRVDAGLDEIWDLAILPQEDSLSPILLATAREQGVFRSKDGGISWDVAEKGLGFFPKWRTPLADDSQRQFELGRSKFYNVRLLVPAGKKRTAYLYGGEGLFLTNNDGHGWIELGTKAFGPSRFVLAAATSPDFERDSTLLVSLKGRGLWVSRDGGATFLPFAQNLIKANHEIHNLAFSQNYPEDQTIYAASREDMLVSSDAGNSWKTVARPIRYEAERGDVVNVAGSWTRQQGSRFSSGAAVRLDGHGSALELVFVGTGVRVVGGDNGDIANIEVQIDGKSLSVRHSMRGKIAGPAEIMHDGLRYGQHTVRIALKIAPEEVATQPTVVIDALDVLGNRKPQSIH